MKVRQRENLLSVQSIGINAVHPRQIAFELLNLAINQAVSSTDARPEINCPLAFDERDMKTNAAGPDKAITSQDAERRDFLDESQIGIIPPFNRPLKNHH